MAAPTHGNNGIEEEFLWTCSLSGANKEYTWAPDVKVGEDKDRSVKPGHKLLIKSAILMPSAKTDEVTIVQIETEGYNKEKVVVPICAMKGGSNHQQYIDLLVPSQAKFSLLQGDGPINLLGSHCVDFFGYRDLDAESDEDDVAGDDDAGMEIKTLDDIKTPTKSHDKSFGDKSWEIREGRIIFIRYMCEKATYEDFKDAFEKHGEVTDFFNTGRGFGYIIYSTEEEAQACLKAKDDTEVAGRTTVRCGGAMGGAIQMSIGDISFREGRVIWIHNMCEEATYEDFQGAFEKHGVVTDFFNSGRGFGFIIYSTAEEAQSCIKAMNNTEVAGRTILMIKASTEAPNSAD